MKDPDAEGIEFTEVMMNKGIKERQLPEKFAGDDFQLLLVANKYQTGFDQPLLHTMYVDKRLSGVQAVQTLSRLNRIANGKEETFVLDFVNDAEEIRRSFQPYYEQTVVAESAEPHQLYELQHRLGAMQVFWISEVDAHDEKKAPLSLDGEVALKYYRINKTSEGAVYLIAAEPVALWGPTDLGTGKAKDVEVPLSEIIDVLNERFGTEFTKADQLLFDQFIQAAKEDHEVVERALANALDNFEG